jgi:hypothetical protein
LKNYLPKIPTFFLLLRQLACKKMCFMRNLNFSQILFQRAKALAVRRMSIHHLVFHFSFAFCLVLATRVIDLQYYISAPSPSLGLWPYNCRELAATVHYRQPNSLSAEYVCIPEPAPKSFRNRYSIVASV